MNFIKIEDFNDKGLDIYARMTETELMHIYEPDTGLFIAESPKVIGRALNAGYEPVSFLVEDGDTDRQMADILAQYAGLPVYKAGMEVLAKLTGFKLTRGALCAMRRRKHISAEDICEGMRRIAVLENVMNPTNIGAIFRSAAALNIDAVLLTKGCSDPLYRRAARVSMGTVFQIPWTYIDIEKKGYGRTCNSILHGLGFKTAAMALRNESVDISDPALKGEEKLAVILGTEGDGLCDTTIKKSDYTIKIPMSDGVDSLNVAAAAAIVFWELGK